MFRYTITEEEYLEMSAFMLKKRRGGPKTAVPKLLLKTVVQMTAAALLIFRYNEGVAPWMKWSLGILSLLWALISFFQYFFVGFRAKMLLAQAKSGPHAGNFWKDHRLELWEDSLHLSFGSERLELPYDEVTEIAETESLHLIFRGRDVFELVPKRAADGFRETFLQAWSAAKAKKMEGTRKSLVKEASFAKNLSISKEELAKELALMKKRSLRYACGWTGFMVFSLGFPLALAVYSAVGGAWPTVALCLLAFVLFNLRLFVIFTPSYRNLIEGRLPDPGEDGYLLAVKGRTAYFLGADSGTSYSMDKLQKKVRDAEGLFLYFEKQNMLFVPQEAAAAFEVAAGLKKSIRAIAASDTGVQADDEEEAAPEQ